VETSWPGVVIGAKEDKLGIRASDTHTIMYNDVKVPKENRIGDDGFGFKFAMKPCRRPHRHRFAGTRHRSRRL
jgi:alkylation response protein AidB-like acyl-CoA dehydrogenase